MPVLPLPPITELKLDEAGWPSVRSPKNKSPSLRPDLVGQKFGSVTIVSPVVEWLGPKSSRRLHVRCECGTCGYRSIIAFSNLRGGRTKGCRACNQPKSYPDWLYQRCQAMRSRCNNKGDCNYERYGARGVEFRFKSPKSAAIWIIKNLGLPEQDRDLQLDRIDNDGHYEPGNLRWLRQKQNMANTRNTRWTPRMHAFRLQNPGVKYADATLRRLMWEGFSDEEIVERYHRPSLKPKGKYGTFSTPDPVIASLAKDS